MKLQNGSDRNRGCGLQRQSLSTLNSDGFQPSRLVTTAGSRRHEEYQMIAARSHNHVGGKNYEKTHAVPSTQGIFSTYFLFCSKNHSAVPSNL
jgi:hypothetical protein